MSENATHQEHAEVEHDRLRLGIIGVAIVAICTVIVALVAFADQYFDVRVEAEQQTKIAERERSWLKDLRVEEAKKLEHYRWVDKNAGVVGVPVERAIDLVIEDYSKPLPPPPAPAAVPAVPAVPAAPNGAAPAAAPAKEGDKAGEARPAEKKADDKAVDKKPVDQKTEKKADEKAVDQKAAQKTDKKADAPAKESAK